MVTQSEVEAEVNERCKVLEGMKVSDSVKQEVASAVLVLECCYVAAKDLEGRLGFPPTVVGLGAEAARGAEQTKIAHLLFESLIARSTQQQQGPGISLGDLRSLRQN